MTEKKFPKSVSVDFDQQTFDSLKKLADADERSLSWVVRKVVKEFLVRKDSERNKIQSTAPEAQSMINRSVK
ncbi:hypothetical protein ACSFBF_14785 [Variovorax sp. ZT5P49]|uniref:hypothetical protein n=1 Tax=Variovorax sp. ZT5P49 TaxID=3443733 RepID=UPI003F482ECC